MFPILVDVEDISFYTDELEKLTSKSRSYWSRFPLWLLKKIYAREIKKRSFNHEQR